MNVHLIGIGGSGLSAIARILLERGHRVSGSDRVPSPITHQLEQAGATVYAGHHGEHVRGAEVVVRSSAIPDDNEEVVAALSLGLPVLKRADFLGQLLEGYKVIAVAGTHGKTTTSAMIAWLLMALNQDPSFIVGGFLNDLGTNAHTGSGEIFVIEADEYDLMFLGLTPDIAVVTNVEFDHPDFFSSADDFHRAFEAFVHRLAPGGILIGYGGDPGAVQLLETAETVGYHAVSYGLSQDMDYYGLFFNKGDRSIRSFDLFRADTRLASVKPPLPGVHNMLNAIAALSVIDLLEMPVGRAVKPLESFSGTARRFQVRGLADGITIIDDYAHHPTEIKATLASARNVYSGNGIWAVWQPHTFSRTRTFYHDFQSAFGDSDHVLVLEVYPARELVDPDLSIPDLVNGMDHPDACYVPNHQEAVGYLLPRLARGDVVIVLSAGDGDQLSLLLLEFLQERSKEHV